jgi:hypothetical protein
MTTARKLAANRANARSSTGPRTAAGKARVARNACRHGLNRPVTGEPALAREVETLARAICGLGVERADAERCDPALRLMLYLARRIAEAQVDLVRVRRLRHDLLARALADPNYRSWRGLAARIALLSQVGEMLARDIPLPGDMARAIQFRPEGAEKFALVVGDLSGELLAFDRYERRAISRRKFAIRAFDEARSGKAFVFGTAPLPLSPPFAGRGARSYALGLALDTRNLDMIQAWDEDSPRDFGSLAGSERARSGGF